MTNNVIAALADIDIPKTLLIERVNDLEALFTDAGRRSLMGFTGEVFFGTAFVQGQRLQFTTAMPIPKMLAVSHADRSKKKDGVAQVTEHSNRPQEDAHAKQLRTYLRETACAGEKFVLPSFTFNYGVDVDPERPQPTLMIFANDDAAANAWPAVLMIPAGEKLDTTDGAHRRSQTAALLEDPKVDERERDALRRNACDVKIIFEGSREDSHQDFADCGKAKPISKSLVATFDVRDRRNRRSVTLVKGSPFLDAYVDATAANVNLSAKSKKIWSMSAVRMFVVHVLDNHCVIDWDADKKTEGAELFFAALVARLPQLSQLEATRLEPNGAGVQTGQLRNVLGGDIALRGIGMALFARAYLYCLKEKVGFDVMADRLAKLEWSILDCERADVDAEVEAVRAQAEKAKTPVPTNLYAQTVIKHARPMWRHLLVISDGTFRVSSRSVDVDEAWEKIVADWPEVVAAAAAKAEEDQAAA